MDADWKPEQLGAYRSFATPLELVTCVYADEESIYHMLICWLACNLGHINN